MPKFEDEIIKGVFEEREVAPEQKHPTFDSEMAFYNLVAEASPLVIPGSAWVPCPYPW